MPRGRRRRKIERWVKPYIRPTDSQDSHNKTQKTLTRKVTSTQASSLRAPFQVKGGSNEGEDDQNDVETTKQASSKPWSRREANPSDP